MIRRYSDLAANERTYLAWLRTAIAVIAFGFLIERFDLILRGINKASGNDQLLHVGGGGREAGLTLVAIGLVVMGISTWRYLSTMRHIQSEQDMAYNPASTLLLGGCLILLGIFVLLYIARLVFA